MISLRLNPFIPSTVTCLLLVWHLRAHQLLHKCLKSPGIKADFPKELALLDRHSLYSLNCKQRKKAWRTVQALAVFQQLFRSLGQVPRAPICIVLPQRGNARILAPNFILKTNLSTSTQLLFPRIYLYFQFPESNSWASAPWNWPCSSHCLSAPRIWLKSVEYAVASGMSPCDLELLFLAL